MPVDRLPQTGDRPTFEQHVRDELSATSTADTFTEHVDVDILVGKHATHSAG